MPSREQQALFERLKAKFGDSPRWEQLTRPYDFDAMAPHKAFHYLQLLLWQLARKSVPSRCGCFGFRGGDVYPERNEHPLEAGARGRARV
jgi:hypothetical protein